ncbi:hypothetical protein [Streptomyces sp. NPDC086777]|uniref:hypothetical protein n=1 Tax=Streptomyces sp. NPDC086777 TaxID=3154866 RepID=UPI00344E2CF3
MRVGTPAARGERADRALGGHGAGRHGVPGGRGVAVTAFGLSAAGPPPERRHVTTRIGAAFDRPFGFLALHRHSRLVLAAGRVTDPLPFPEYPWEDDE